MTETFYTVVLTDLQSLDGNQVVNVKTLERAKEIMQGLAEEYPIHHGGNNIVTSEDGLNMYDDYQEFFDITIYETHLID